MTPGEVAQERTAAMIEVNDADLAPAMVQELRRELEQSRRQSAANAVVVTRALARIAELETEKAAMSQRITDLMADEPVEPLPDGLPEDPDAPTE